ncbi:hypothetical protein BH10PLA1_BH10PLA1_03690 [soil metagenome]
MAINFEPSTPLEAYKAIIDQLVQERTNGVSERLLRDDGIYSKAPGDEAANKFVRSLTDEQKNLLADMLRRERFGAIGGVLADFTWWFCCRDVGFTFRGEAMPFELGGEGMHGDYVARSDGWEWPENE